MDSVKKRTHRKRIYLKCLITERLVQLALFFFGVVNLIFRYDIVLASRALSLMGYLWGRTRIVCTREISIPTTLRDKLCPSLHSNIWRSNWNRRCWRELERGLIRALVLFRARFKAGLLLNLVQPSNWKGGAFIRIPWPTNRSMRHRNLIAY